MTSCFKMERIIIVDQLFIRRLHDNTIGLLVVKIVHDFFKAGAEEEIKHFLHYLNEAFFLGASSIRKSLMCLSCGIMVQEKSSVEISRHYVYDRIPAIQVSKDRKFSPQL